MTPYKSSNQGLLGSGLKGANPPGSRLKGSFSKPLGRRTGNSAGLSQAGKYITQNNTYDSINNSNAGGYPPNPVSQGKFY